LYDEKAIYLGIEIVLADAERILNDLKAAPLKDEKVKDVYRDRHSVEIFLQPPGEARYIQCVVSLDGYRYDGVALDNSWNGQWTYGISVGKDRWCLEVMIPASDLNLEKIESTEGWRLNIVDNREGNYSTWAAVGNNYHNPFGFGALATKDFSRWRQEKLQGWDEIRKKAAEGADKYGLAFADRLARTGEFSKAIPGTSGSDKLDWETVTRVYTLMNFVDTVYRVMDAEMSYARFFTGK